MIKSRTGRSPQIRYPQNIHGRKRSWRPLERKSCADKRERVRWSLEPPKASSKSHPYKTRSDEREVKRKVEEERSGGGSSKESDLGAKRRKKRKIKWQKERKRATLPRSDHLWSRSPSHGGEGRPCSLEQGGKRVRWGLEVAARVWRMNWI